MDMPIDRIKSSGIVLARAVAAIFELVAIAIVGVGGLLVIAVHATTYVAVGSLGLIHGKLGGVIAVLGGGVLIYLGRMWYRDLLRTPVKESHVATALRPKSE